MVLWVNERKNSFLLVASLFRWMQQMTLTWNTLVSMAKFHHLVTLTWRLFCEVKRKSSEFPSPFVPDPISITHFFLALNALDSKTLRFFDLFKQGVDGISDNSAVSSRFSADPMAPTIFRSPLNIPGDGKIAINLNSKMRKNSKIYVWEIHCVVSSFS